MQPSLRPPVEPQNPYAVPLAAQNAGAPAAYPDHAVLATRMERLRGAFVDGAVQMVWMAVPIAMSFAMRDGSGAAPQLPPWTMTLVMPVMLLVNGIQAYLVATTGQSLGKKVVGTRIVQMDGSPAGFVRGVLLRSWLLFFVQALPKLGPLLWLANHLAIFGPDSRCGHDRLAGTKVVKATRAP